jgi:hypothetical protein
MLRRLLAAAVMTAALCGLARADFYVAPGGDDAQPGTKEKPFQTLERAQAAVRQAIRSQPPAGPVTVWIAPGTYRRGKTFTLTAEDSGGERSPVVYRGEPGGEGVRLSGGMAIPAGAFHPVADAAVLRRLDPAARGHVLQADLKALGIRDFGEVAAPGRRAEVFFDDRPLTPARWPNEGFATIASVVGGKPIKVHGIAGDAVGKFTLDSDRPARWAGESDVWLHGYWFWDWSDAYQRVESLDPKTRTLAVAPPYHHYGYRKGQRFYALNLLAELDSPGEWHLDRKAGTLYLWPPAPPVGRRVVLSLLETPLVAMRDAAHVTLRGLTLEATRGLAVEIAGGRNCLVAGCTIRNTGGGGVAVQGGQKHGVQSCDIYQTGSSGVSLTGGDRRALAPAGLFAVNNHIHHFARLQRTYAGAVHVQGVGNRMANNLIHDAPHMAVGFGGNENLFELNEIHDVCRETGDVGVFYTGRDWTVRGNVLRHNYIHHASGPGLHGAQGIYLDDAASGSIVFGNVLYKVARAMLLGGGRDNTVENNLMIECPISIHFDNRGLNWMHETVAPGGYMHKLLEAMPYQQPPWRDRYPQLLTLMADAPAAPKGNLLRWNVAVKCGPMHLAKEVTQYGTVAENLATNEDLGFVDLVKPDFRLRPDSSLWKKLPKFQPIPMEKIGLEADEYRPRP